MLVLNSSGYLIERLLGKAPSIAYNDVAPWRYTELPYALGRDGWFQASLLAIVLDHASCAGIGQMRAQPAWTRYSAKYRGPTDTGCGAGAHAATRCSARVSIRRAPSAHFRLRSRPGCIAESDEGPRAEADEKRHLKTRLGCVRFGAEFCHAQTGRIRLRLHCESQRIYQFC